MKTQFIASGGFIGRHRVLAQLGQGGMADVFLAVAPGPVGLNKLVVIKRLRDNRQDEEFLGMFLNEADIAARLNHPNVIHLYEVAQDEALVYLVMEYLDGQPLQRIRGSVGTDSLPLGLHLRMLCDALLGLQYAHELIDYDGAPLGIVHRDLSPHNIFVTYEGTTKILDFGIAKALNQTAHTRVGGVKGKIHFMSPEQARGGSQTVDRRSDVFTMGILLWEAAVGRRLWKGDEEAAIFQRLLRGDPMTAPRTVNPAVHPRLERICMRALNVDRDKRYSSAEELRLDIEDYMVQTSLRANSMDVGRFVSERFSQERESFRATIDGELRHTSSRMAVPASVPISGTSRVNYPAVRPSQHSAIPGTDAVAMPVTEVAARPPMEAASLPATIVASPSGQDEHATRKQRSARALRLIGLGLASATIGAAGWWGMGRVQTPPETAAVAAPQVASVANTAVTPTTVTLSIDVAPATAQVFLDDKPLGVGPFKGPVLRAPGVHHVRAEASAYKPASAKVSLEFDSVVQLSLAPEHQAARPARAAYPVKTVAQPTPTPTRPASKKKPPVVSIDTETPW